MLGFSNKSMLIVVKLPHRQGLEHDGVIFFSPVLSLLRSGESRKNVYRNTDFTDNLV